ncbi:hypothetical protein PPERSA_02396 [Pseudocohnilembus persalinus]|uniref:Uncharacterized protein n=1 Tax=Pseudocohnilembus persalinus TaxID=266149 RepID=A0A0V0QBI1_PSEPJ|nr:hypothetical protein PPERSA_02396 [Pseudocohnilembus persalinus]|eukprot:KRW99538.1 hypothetical protein PPERSA_02396 [Pseudocohnilembus persalinus]
MSEEKEKEKKSKRQRFKEFFLTEKEIQQEEERLKKEKQQKEEEELNVMYDFQIKGGNLHTELIQAMCIHKQGEEEGLPVPLKCAWFIIDPKQNTVTPLPDIQGGYYMPCIDDVGYQVCVQATPVLDSEDYSGPPLKTNVGPLVVDPEVDQQIQQYLENNGGEFEISLVEVIGDKDFKIDEKPVKLERKLAYMYDLFEIVLEEEKSLKIRASSNIQRDIIAVLFRNFTGKQIMGKVIQEQQNLPQIQEDEKDELQSETSEKIEEKGEKEEKIEDDQNEENPEQPNIQQNQENQEKNNIPENQNDNQQIDLQEKQENNDKNLNNSNLKNNSLIKNNSQIEQNERKTSVNSLGNLSATNISKKNSINEDLQQQTSNTQNNYELFAKISELNQKIQQKNKEIQIQEKEKKKCQEEIEDHKLDKEKLKEQIENLSENYFNIEKQNEAIQNQCTIVEKYNQYLLQEVNFQQLENEEKTLKIQNLEEKLLKLEEKSRQQAEKFAQEKQTLLDLNPITPEQYEKIKQEIQTQTYLRINAESELKKTQQQEFLFKQQNQALNEKIEQLYFKIQTVQNKYKTLQQEKSIKFEISEIAKQLKINAQPLNQNSNQNLNLNLNQRENLSYQQNKINNFNQNIYNNKTGQKEPQSPQPSPKFKTEIKKKNYYEEEHPQFYSSQNVFQNQDFDGNNSQPDIDKNLDQSPIKMQKMKTTNFNDDLHSLDNLQLQKSKSEFHQQDADLEMENSALRSQLNIVKTTLENMKQAYEIDQQGKIQYRDIKSQQAEHHLEKLANKLAEIITDKDMALDNQKRINRELLNQVKQCEKIIKKYDKNFNINFLENFISENLEINYEISTNNLDEIQTPQKNVKNQTEQKQNSNESQQQKNSVNQEQNDNSDEI